MKHSLCGCTNGPFETLRVPEDILATARSGSYHPLAEWKRTNLERFLKALAQLVLGSPNLGNVALVA